MNNTQIKQKQIFQTYFQQNFDSIQSDYKSRIEVEQSRIHLYFEGQNSKFSQHVLNCLEFFKSIEMNLKQFQLNQQNIMKKYDNSTSISDQVINYLFLQKQSPNIIIKEFQQTIQNFTIQNLEQNVKTLFENVNMDLLFIGNVQKDKAKKLSHLIRSQFLIKKVIKNKKIIRQETSIKSIKSEALVYQINQKIDKKLYNMQLQDLFSQLQIESYVLSINSMVFQKDLLLFINEDNEYDLDQELIYTTALEQLSRYESVNKKNDNYNLYLKGLNIWNKNKNLGQVKSKLQNLVQITRKIQV